ncbi:hypothetical protein BDZ45DRAFT_724711 [Acephala macrosclerotiorum]|nr:hypothetical protein BDZ45DRAFT_724711 [Acephala macrosclerotiorum]
MAILADLPGIEVVVVAGGIALEEFEDEEDPGTTKATCSYIESVADQEFGIKYIVQRPHEFDCDMLGFQFYVDGSRLVSKALPRKWYEEHYHFHEFFVTGVTTADGKTKQGKLRPFRFSKIETTLDDDAYTRVERDMDRMAKVGSIEVKLWRMKQGEKVAWKNSKNTPEPSTVEVHEKALKGAEISWHFVSLPPLWLFSFSLFRPCLEFVNTHCNGWLTLPNLTEPVAIGNATYFTASADSVRLGDAKQIRVPKTKRSGSRMDEHPIACFTFKYRSKQALKELLVIERSPEPEELALEASEANDLDLTNLGEEQKREVLAFARNLTQSGSSQGARIKRERANEDRTFSERKKPRNAEEVKLIDLTGD